MVKAIQWLSPINFQPPTLPLQYLLGFPILSYSCSKEMLKRNLAKWKLFSSQQGLNPHSCTYQAKAKPFNQSRFHDNSYKF